MAVPSDNQYVLAVDLGTSGCKAALVSSDGVVQRWAFRPVPLHILDEVGAEQAPEDWWSALVGAVRELTAALPDLGGQIVAICCSSQGECTVAVDEAGNPLHRAMLWMDMRGAEAIRARAGSSLLTISGYAPLKLWRWIRLTGGAPALSGKDSTGHIAFIRQTQPELYERTHKFLNALDYLNLRLTGRFVATVDSILTTWVTDNRDASNVRYDAALLAQCGIDREKLPEIVRCTEVLGTLCAAAAEELGLPRQTPVVAGSIDTSAAAVGSGAIGDGAAHLYIGTSSWIGAHVPFKKTDVLAQIASVPCAVPQRYLAMAMQSAAGSNLSFLCEKFLSADDGLGGDRPADVYAVIDRVAASAPPGARGLLYMPWLCGERSPVDDANLRAGLLNLSLQHSRADVIRAMMEGVALNTRWMAAKLNGFLGRPLEAITMVGGGANSALWCQIFADVLGIGVRQSEAPIQANALGAAMIAFVGIGAISMNDVPALTRIRHTYEPNNANVKLYDEMYENFEMAYRRLAPLYRRMNSARNARA